ncbi:MAG: WYL domain-containing protein [Solimonas sp.]
MDQFERIFVLHRLLRGRSTAVSVDTMIETLHEQGHRCSPATLKRDLRDLRNRFHMPLLYDRELGGYRYEGDGIYELPGLWFSSQELAALLIVEEVLEQQPLGLLSEALAPLRGRIERLLRRSGVGVPDWRSRLRLLRMAARDPGSQFHIVADALVRRRRLRIDYHARADDRMQQRVVSPQRLTLYRDNWYLDAWCHRREDLRTFALERIIAVEALDEAAREVAAAQLDGVLATSYGIFAGQPSAIAALRFSAHAARWVAAERWHPQQMDERDEDGRLIRRLPYHRSEELVMDLLRHGPDVEVLEPLELRRIVAERLRLAAEQYQEGAGSDINGRAERIGTIGKDQTVDRSSSNEPGGLYRAKSVRREESR